MASPFTSAGLFSSSSVVVLPRNYGDLLTRSPKYRNSRTGGARSTRTQIDHDVFEGLPVRHWRKRAINVNTAPEKEKTTEVKSRNLAWPELEMPRDAHLLSEMSQNLLRGARMPQVKKTLTAPLMEDDKEPGEDEDADGEVDTGFVAKRWAVMPKEMEGPEPEFLAKRRKGLPSIHGGALAAVGSMQQMRKTKIRKIDTSGNSSVLEVLVPDGQTVDGEIFEEETSPTQAPAPGTVVEGVGVVNAEGLVIAGDQSLPANNRRRPPPPKRKAKGPGRGKKKKVAFARADGKPTSIEVNGVPVTATGNEEGYLIDGAQAAPGQDTSMGEHSMLQEGDLEGEEGSEEGSEGEEGEDGEREEGELSLSASPSRSPPKAPSPVKVAPQHLPQTSLPGSPVPQRGAPSPTQTMNLISDPVIESVIKPVQDSTIGPKADTMDEALDGMLGELNDEMLDVPSTSIADEPAGKTSPKNIITPTEKSITQPHLRGDTTDLTIGKPTEVIQVLASELAKEATAEAEMTTKASTKNTITVAIPQATEQLPTNVTTAPLADVVVQLIAEPVADPVDETIVEAQTEIKPESSIDVTSEPTAKPIPESSMDVVPEPKAAFVPELSVDFASGPKAVFIPEPLIDVTLGPKAEVKPESSMDIISEPKAVFITEPSMEVMSESKDKSITGPTVEPACESPVEVITEPPAEHTAEPIAEITVEPIAELMSEPTREATPPLSTVFSTVTIIQAAEDPVPATLVETKVEAMPEPVVQRAAEHSAEPVGEATERRFSFTRPTASPKAPTPSPPTPIEEKFGLRAPYYSPKAPTMSPPTPIPRSMPSSPEMPLSELRFQLPPQIDDMPAEVMAPAPDVQDIPNADRITVESTRQGGPQLNAQIPVDHNPLDGLAAPNVVYGYDAIGRKGENEAPEQFSDGEEDLLGSLERSLDRRGNGS